MALPHGLKTSVRFSLAKDNGPDGHSDQLAKACSLETATADCARGVSATVFRIFLSVARRLHTSEESNTAEPA